MPETCPLCGSTLSHPDRYVITGSTKEGERRWLHWLEECGGWWQWGSEGHAERFSEKSGRRYEDALWCAKNTLPLCEIDPDTVETVAVPAVVKIVVT